MIIPRVGGPEAPSLSFVSWLPPSVGGRSDRSCSSSCNSRSSVSSRRRKHVSITGRSPIWRSSLLRKPVSNGRAVDDVACEGKHGVVQCTAMSMVDAREAREERSDRKAGKETRGDTKLPTERKGEIARPAWAKDPSAAKLKNWIHAAAWKRDHESIVMYLRKYRDGRALRGEAVPVAIYNLAMKTLSDCRRWRLAVDVFREMRADGVDADRNSYYLAIHACSMFGEARTAVQFLSEMKETHVKKEGPAPDIKLHSITVKACAYGRAWRQALRIVDEMSAAGGDLRPNVVVLNTALSACAKCGQTMAATKLLRDMEATYGVTPDATSYNCVIGAHKRVGDWREALSLFREMETIEGLSPDTVTFNSVIGACKRAGRPTEALAVLSLMRRRGLKPDLISFNSAISACASKGVWKTAIQLLEAMPGEGVKPDLTTYNSALDACARSSLEVMSKTLQPAVAAHNQKMTIKSRLLRVFVPPEGGQWEMALSLFEELSSTTDSSLVPDLYTYNTLMTVYSRSGMLVRALELLEEVKASGLRPDVVTYSTLIRACERSLPPQPDVALQLISDMEAAGVTPNNKTFVSVALSLGRAGRALECLQVLEAMRKRGTKPDAITCQTVLMVLDRWDRPKEASALFDEMREQGLAVSPDVSEEAYCCGIRALEKLGKWREAVVLMEEWRGVNAARKKGAESDSEKDYDQWYRALNLLAMGGLPGETDAKTVRAAMVAAARGGLGEEALAIMRNMEAMGFELGVVEYGAAMEAFEQQWKPERSLEIFDEMVTNGVEPDVLCFAAAVRCSRVQGDWANSIRLLETALRCGLYPNSSTFRLASRLCAQLGKYEELWNLKELMREMVREEGSLARPGSAIYVSLMRACGAAGRPDLVLRCLAEMNFERAPGRDWRKQALEEPGTLSAAVGALYKCDETVEADRIYADAIRQKILPDPASGPTWSAAVARTVTANERRADAKAEALGRSGSTEPLAFKSDVTGIDVSSGTQTRRGEAGDSQRQRNSLEDREQREQAYGEEGKAAELVRGNVAVLWADVRRAPVDIIPAVVSRIVNAVKAVGAVSDGLVIEWSGGRSVNGEDDGGNGNGHSNRGASPAGGSSVEHGGKNPRGAASAGRRETLLEAFAAIEPAIEVIESSNSRGQLHVDKGELHRWLSKVRQRQAAGGNSREGS